ncbi:hypothetical protein [Bradyrhizobium niftali]|uniref:Uncharacterized protein n=1 Tax=Bradyrhizobium niftali TaxID=2560055 RepID=A0A4Y9M351_9BRAD|nr:hypothetical protein [Bradyrhizobium niftali]TFV49624.1 hypothetical protein E4K65_05335 [Bradyrhizobium niftali]
MIVTEDDLNRLDHYIIAKQRLHNLQLHGVGVVSGLIVTCHPCGDGRVRVSAGYAIGPCGDDIVVCKDDVVDICELIQRCRALERRDVECRPWGDTKGCSELREDWILAIRYDEQPSRNAPMLRAGSAGSCDCGDSCGGGDFCECGGSCGCHSAPASTKSRQVRTAMPIACAPSVVCETYRYEVFRAPRPPTKLDVRENPALGWAREAEIFECLWDLIAIAAARPAAHGPEFSQADRQAWTTYCRTIKQAILEYMDRHGTQHCAALAAVCALPCPDPAANNQLFGQQTTLLSQTFAQAVLTVFKDCICLKLLPPLQPEACDPRLPLAAVTVDTSGGCNVVDICNWTPLRPIVLSAPAIEHWLGLLDISAQLHKLMARLCCGSPRVVMPHGFRVAADRAPEAMMAQPGAFAAHDAGAEPGPIGQEPGPIGGTQPPAADIEWQDMFAARVTLVLEETLLAASQSGAPGALLVLRAVGESLRNALRKALLDSTAPAPFPEETAALLRRIEALEARLDSSRPDNPPNRDDLL